MTAHPTPKQSPCLAGDGPAWREEWIPLDAIHQHSPLQVRQRLDPAAIKRYRAQASAGMVPPPIKVGRTGNGALYLLDGWHRIAAGALQTAASFTDPGHDVCAMVADLSEAEIRWEAARANMSHGVPLKSGEYRNVFRAFIKAKKHRKVRGQLMSYREMEPLIGKRHTTLRNWMMEDFPGIARAMGGNEHGNPTATVAPVEPLSLAEEQCAAALKALSAVQLALQQMTPEGRWQARELLHRALAEVDRLGARGPDAAAAEF